MQQRQGAHCLLAGSGMLCLVARWLGVDVGGKRKGFDIALVDDRRVLALNGGLDRTAVIEFVETNQPRTVAIDSPRCYAPEGQTTRDGERHLAKAICSIRWTPDARHVHASAYYAWIVEGLALFDALVARAFSVGARGSTWRRKDLEHSL